MRISPRLANEKSALHLVDLFAWRANRSRCYIKFVGAHGDHESALENHAGVPGGGRHLRCLAMEQRKRQSRSTGARKNAQNLMPTRFQDCAQGVRLIDSTRGEEAGRRARNNYP